MLRWTATVAVSILVAVAIGMLITSLMSPTYQARASVYVQDDENGLTLPGNLPLNIFKGSSNPLEYALVILKSRDFARSIVERNGLLLDPQFTLGKRLTMPEALERLERMVQAESDEGLIVVTANARHARLAARLANLYIDSFSGKVVTATQTRRRYTGNRIEQIEQEVRQTEGRLRDLGERSEIADLDKQTLASVERLAQMESALQQIGVELKGIESKLRTTGDMAELARLKGEQQAALARRNRVQQDAQALRSQMRSIPQIALERARLERELALKAKLYETLAEQHQIALINEKGEQGVYQTVDRAEEPLKPYRPDLFTNFMVSLLLGLLIGIAINLAGASHQ